MATCRVLHTQQQQRPFVKCLWDALSCAEDVCGKMHKNVLGKECLGQVLYICMDYVYRVAMREVGECKFKK